MTFYSQGNIFIHPHSCQAPALYKCDFPGRAPSNACLQQSECARVFSTTSTLTHLFDIVSLRLSHLPRTESRETHPITHHSSALPAARARRMIDDGFCSERRCHADHRTTLTTEPDSTAGSGGLRGTSPYLFNVDKIPPHILMFFQLTDRTEISAHETAKSTRDRS
jgi:hypothetical protein